MHCAENIAVPYVLLSNWRIALSGFQHLISSGLYASCGTMRVAVERKDGNAAA
jgi:hypothetical protein